MNQREVLIEKYAKDLKAKFNLDADMALLKQITIGLGPSIYKRDASTVSSSESSELERIKEVFLIKKLKLDPGNKEDFDTTLDNILQEYGKTNRTKYRAVVYYLLVKHYNKEAIYNL